MSPSYLHAIILEVGKNGSGNERFKRMYSRLAIRRILQIAGECHENDMSRLHPRTYELYKQDYQGDQPR